MSTLQRPGLLAALIFSATFTNAHAQGSPCDSILRDGTMAKADYRSRNELKRLLHWRFASQELEKSNSDQSFGATIPIKGVLVGADFSQSEEREAQRAISSSLDMQLIQNYTLSYMLTSGDPVIAKAWSECMRDRGGFFVWFGQRQGAAAPVQAQFHSPTDREQSFTISDAQWTWIAINGSRQKSEPFNVSCLEPGRVYKAGDSCSFTLDSVDPAWGGLLVVNGKYATSGGATQAVSAFVPPNMQWVVASDRVVSSQLNPPIFSSRAEQYDTGGSRAYQLPEVCIARSQINMPASFIRSSATTSTSGHCAGSDGACNGRVTSVTDEKFCWAGSMVVDRHKSCGCTVTGSINVFRSRWVPAGLQSGTTR